MQSIDSLEKYFDCSFLSKKQRQSYSLKGYTVFYLGISLKSV